MTAKKTLPVLIWLTLLAGSFLIGSFLAGSFNLHLIQRAYAEGPVLEQTTNEVTVDGIIRSGEYSYLYEIKKLSLRLNRTSDSFYAAVTAETDGWVAVGLNSSEMNKADIIIGYFSKGKEVIKEQRGFRHKHKDNDIFYVKSYAVGETSGKTTLEVELVSKDVIKPGQKTLSMIMAFGRSDSLKTFHKRRASVTVKLQN